MEVKYRRNITFLEARKIVESYLKVNTYANIAQKAICYNNQLDKYRVLIKKLVQLGPNNWLIFLSLSFPLSPIHIHI